MAIVYGVFTEMLCKLQGTSGSPHIGASSAFSNSLAMSFVECQRPQTRDQPE